MMSRVNRGSRKAVTQQSGWHRKQRLPNLLIISPSRLFRRLSRLKNRQPDAPPYQISLNADQINNWGLSLLYCVMFYDNLAKQKYVY